MPLMKSPHLLTASLLLLTTQLPAATRTDISLQSLAGDAIPARLSVPDGPVPAGGHPACLLLHGSGGLLRENGPGLTCGPALESNYEAVFTLLESLNVIVLAPDSFGRHPLFCEDNDEDYFGWVPPPLHNPGDGVPARDNAYDTRRTLTRVLDAGAGLAYLQALPQVDPLRTCALGTSNGGTIVLGLAAIATGRHASQYADISQQRPLESASQFQERQQALANYPTLPPGIEASFNALPVLTFAQAISPGCFLRRFIPTADPDVVNVLDWPLDFFHPEHARDGYLATELHVEIGGDDDVPDHCRPDGIRHRQAVAHQQAFGIDPPMWRPVEYPGFGHDLLGDNPVILEHTRQLVLRHFFDPIFADGVE
ncbi:MAG: hypothetical protein R3F15_01865 [Lysobacterales bacterium]